MLCVDEKSQIKAPDRTAPILPMLPGTPARQTHDYLRHGTYIWIKTADQILDSVSRY